MHVPHRARWSSSEHLDPSLARFLLEHGDALDRQLLATHPAAQPDLLRELADDLDLHEALYTNPSADAALQVELVRACGPRLARLASSPHLRREALEELLATYPSLLSDLAANPVFPQDLRDEELLELGPSCSHPCPCAALASSVPSRPLTPEALELLVGAHPRSWASLAKRVDLDARVLEELLESGDVDVRFAAARAGRLSEDQLDTLAASDLSRDRPPSDGAFTPAGPHARDHQVAAKAPLTRARARVLLESPDPFVAASLAINPTLDHDLQEHLFDSVGDSSEDLRCLAANRDLAPGLALRLAQVDDFLVLMSLVGNPAASPAALRCVLADVSPHWPAWFLEQLVKHPTLEDVLGLPAVLLLEHDPARLFLLGSAAGLDDEVLDALVTEFAGTVAELFDVVREFSANAS